MGRRYRSGWWLEVKYWDEGLTQREIGEVCDVSASTIRKQMKRFGIPTRDIAGENHPLYGRERPDEVKEKISQTMEGRSFSEETRRRIAEAQRGVELSADVRQKISRSLQGMSRSKETRRKMSRSTAGERNQTGVVDTADDTASDGRQRANECGDATACANTVATTVRSERLMFTTSFQSDCSGRRRESYSKPLTTNETSFSSASDVTVGLNTIASTFNRAAVSL